MLLELVCEPHLEQQGFRESISSSRITGTQVMQVFYFTSNAKLFPKSLYQFILREFIVLYIFTSNYFFKLIMFSTAIFFPGCICDPPSFIKYVATRSVGSIPNKDSFLWSTILFLMFSPEGSSDPRSLPMSQQGGALGRQLDHTVNGGGGF